MSSASRHSRPRRIAILAALAAVACAGTAEAKPFNTKAVLELGYHDAAGFREFEVTVSSKKHKCEKGRKIVVFERFAGGDEKVAAFKTFEDGVGFFDHPGPSFGPNEVFFAKVRQKRVGGDRCRAGESKSVTFQG